MQKTLLKLLSVVVCISIFVTAFSASSSVSAASKSQLQNSIAALEEQSKELEAEIKALQGKINEQSALKKAIEKKIALVQEEINLCNAEISKINTAIKENNAAIEERNSEIEADKLEFKKRLRAIYMSNSQSEVQILLGANDFASFLQLSQLTATVSARDKLLIENLVAEIKELEALNDENNKLLEEQVEIKKLVAQKQQELLNENASIQSVINEIDSAQTSLENKNESIEEQIKEYEKMIESMASASGNTSVVYDGGDFLWPTPGFYRISAGYQSNDAVHRGRHNGIDIIGGYSGAIAGAAIVAIADGVVTRANNTCRHNYAKNGSCGCGGGYGNYCTVNHGTNNGRTYVATYGHMSYTTVSVGQHVKKGDVIGYVGTTGWSTGYHLHFGLSVNGAWVNPMNYYSKVK